jgi:hypothetical protein
MSIRVVGSNKRLSLQLPGEGQGWARSGDEMVPVDLGGGGPATSVVGAVDTDVPITASGTGDVNIQAGDDVNISAGTGGSNKSIVLAAANGALTGSASGLVSFTSTGASSDARLRAAGGGNVTVQADTGNASVLARPDTGATALVSGANVTLNALGTGVDSGGLLSLIGETIAEHDGAGSAQMAHIATVDDAPKAIAFCEALRLYLIARGTMAAA